MVAALYARRTLAERRDRWWTLVRLVFSEIRIYYEGAKALQPGFETFFRELKSRSSAQKRRLRFIPARSGAEAASDFSDALKSHPDAWIILLIDSEGPYESAHASSLCQKYKWNPSHADSIFWMVQMMESWFHADKDALEKFYGQGFNRGALKPNPNVEEISKADLKSGLQSATRNTKPGDYFDNKTSHGPKILEKLDPALVRAAAPNCKKLFDTVLKGLG